MDDEGFVSLWAAAADDERTVQRLLVAEYSEDGDFLGGAFSRAFGIADYHEGFVEIQSISVRPITIEALVGDASDAPFVVRELAAACPAIPADARVSVLIYNVRHTGIASATVEGVRVWFVGCVRYRREP